MRDIYSIKAEKNSGSEISLSDYKGRVLLIVNTASKCGFTPQYSGLQELYDEYKDQGFEVLGFPCDQFAHQEPGSRDEIAQFCTLNFGVNFPLFSKVDVNGDGAHPLFKHLKKSAKGLFGEKIKWNFTKFLIDREGRVISRFAPTTKPVALKKSIEDLL